MRKALFAAGVSVAFTLAMPSSAYTVPPTLGEEVRVKYEDKIASVEALETKAEQLIAQSEEQLKLHEEAYYDMFSNEFRLTKQHVTFASRLVLNEDKLLHSSRSVSGSLNNAYSLNLLTPSAVTAYELDQYLAGTKMAGLGSAFVNAELTTGVNAIFLTSLAIHESGWGKSKIAQNKKNLYGYGAYDGSAYQSALSFGSFTEGTTFVADKIKTNYLVSSGKYYAGSTLAGVNKHYSSDSKWSSKIAATMNQIDASIIANQNTSYEVN